MDKSLVSEGMPMLLRLLQLLNVFLIAMVTSPASAGTINVLGSVDMGLGEGVLNLVGDRGFTLNGVARFFGPGAEHCLFPTCPPGATISVNAFSSGSEFFAGATLEGVSYPHVGSVVCPPSPCSFPTVAFTGQVVAPPFGESTTVTLTVPVDFSASFQHAEFVDGHTFSSEQLVASAIATLTLEQFDFGPQFPGPQMARRQPSV
jgi:hypothetical protein